MIYYWRNNIQIFENSAVTLLNIYSVKLEYKYIINKKMTVANNQKLKTNVVFNDIVFYSEKAWKYWLTIEEEIQAMMSWNEEIHSTKYEETILLIWRSIILILILFQRVKV